MFPPPPPNTLSFSYLSPIKFSPPKSQPRGSSCAVEWLPIFQVSDYFSCPSIHWNLTVLLHCWLIDDVNLEETVPPAANFFKMFSLIFKNPFWALQNEVTLKGITCLAPQPAGWLAVSGTSNRRVSRPSFLTCWVKRRLGFPTALGSHHAVIHLSDGQCSDIRHRMLEILGEVSVL